jgi:hypothetical protein
MPIGTSHMHTSMANQSIESNVLVPLRQRSEIPDLNFVDNKEILSFHSKPANMCSSVISTGKSRKNNKEGRLIKENRASKAKNMLNLESHSSVLSKN